jgi:hypothetical protein
VSTEDEDKKTDDRKARVLHTRIPEHLDEEIRKKAGSLGISVSNLVRNVLANTFGLVEDIVADSASVARTARGEDHPPKKPAEAPSVLGFQTVTLNQNALCERCNAILPRGASAGVGVTDGPGPRPILCLPCVEKTTNPETP